MNKKLFEDMIKEQQQQQEQQQEGSSGVTEFVNKQNVEISKDFHDYERLCRGEEIRVRIRFISAFSRASCKSVFKLIQQYAEALACSTQAPYVCLVYFVCFLCTVSFSYCT